MRPRRRGRRQTVLATLALLGACGGSDPDHDPGFHPAPLQHDFGTIRHGQVAEFVYVIPVPATGGPYRPLAYRKDCSCGVPAFRVRGRDGRTREAGDDPLRSLVVHGGETLLMRLQVDTRVKEAVDQPAVTFNGSVVLQDAAGRGQRISVPVGFRFAIDAPVEIRPTAAIDFGDLPRAHSYSQVLELHGDRNHPRVRFGPVETSDPSLQAELREQPATTLLDISFHPDPMRQPGPMRMLIRVRTDLEDGYVVPIPVTGRVIPDVVVEPSDHIGFNRIDFSRPAERFVNVTDYDTRRQAGFHVLDIRDANGAPLDAYFEVRLQPIEGAPRTTRVFVRYRGGMTGRFFRGRARLAKPGSRRVIATVHFVGYNKMPNQAR